MNRADTLRAQAMVHWQEQVRHLTEYLRLVREADDAETAEILAAEERRELRMGRMYCGPGLREAQA